MTNASCGTVSFGLTMAYTTSYFVSSISLGYLFVQSANYMPFPVVDSASGVPLRQPVQAPQPQKSVPPIIHQTGRAIRLED